MKRRLQNGGRDRQTIERANVDQRIPVYHLYELAGGTKGRMKCNTPCSAVCGLANAETRFVVLRCVAAAPALSPKLRERAQRNTTRGSWLPFEECNCRLLAVCHSRFTMHFVLYRC